MDGDLTARRASVVPDPVVPRDAAALSEAADRQAGLVTRAQCLAAGFTDAYIAHRLAAQRWSRVSTGVYLTVPGLSGPELDAASALLAVADTSPVAIGGLRAWEGTPPAALWGPAAARAWGWKGLGAVGRIIVAVPVGRDVVPLTGVGIRRIRKWRGLVDPLVFPWRTTRAATVVDCASLGTADDALARLATAMQAGWVSGAMLLAELTRRQRVRHGVLMREALGDIVSGAHSAAEVRYVRDVERSHGLPPATRQAPSRANGGAIHDNTYEEFDIVIEVDGRLGHEAWSSRVSDGRRDRQLAGRAGRWTSRVFWSDVAVTPCATAREVGDLLLARGWRGNVSACRRPDCTVRAGSPSLSA